METRFGSGYREVRDTEGSMSLHLLFRLSTRNGGYQRQKFANILMLMIFAVFVQPLKSISYWKCFHNCGRLWNHLHWLTGIAIFAPIGPLNSSGLSKGWVELNRLPRCSESTSMKSRNDFNLYRVDLYRNDRTPKRVTELLFTDLLISFIY